MQCQDLMRHSYVKRADNNFEPDLTPLDCPDVHPSHFSLCCRIQLPQGGRQCIFTSIFSVFLLQFFELTVVTEEQNISSISNTSAEVVEVPITQVCYFSYQMQMLCVWRVLCPGVHNNFPLQTFITVAPKLIKTDPLQTFQVGPTSLRLEPLYIKVVQLFSATSILIRKPSSTNTFMYRIYPEHNQ